MPRTRVASARQVFFNTRPVPPTEQTERERSFFKSLALANGTHKTTAPARLRDVDQVVCERFAGAGAVRLLDVGISSGVTTLELLEQFERQGIRAGGVGVDICVRGRLCSILGVDVLYDGAGRVLQVATPLFARGRPRNEQKSPQSRLLGLGMNFFELPFVRRLLMRSRSARPIDLVSRSLLERPDFSVVEHDISLPAPDWSESFDLVRAANVLNRDYFAPELIAIMLKNLTACLRPGGSLVVVRTAADGVNHGDLYLKPGAANALERACQFGDGYELDELVIGLGSASAGEDGR